MEKFGLQISLPENLFKNKFQVRNYKNDECEDRSCK